MESKELNSQIIIKLLIIEIFPSLEELTNNNTESITISFQDKYNDNDILFNLTELLISKKELDLSFSSKNITIKLILNKNDNLFASGQFPLKNIEQWVTLTYENKKHQDNSKIASTLMDCIKLKIQCKIISGYEPKNKVEFIKKSFNLKKKSKPKLNTKKKLSKKKLNINYLMQDSFTNTEDNKKSNRYIDNTIKTPTPNTYTTINKSNIKKIELSSIKTNKFSNKNNNYTTLRIENFKNISQVIPSKPKNFSKSGKKNREGHEGDIIYQRSEIKTKMKNMKRSLEDIHLNLNLKNIKHKSSIGIKTENSKSNKKLKKRKSDGINKVNIIDNLYDINNNIYCKTNYNFHNNNNLNISKKKSSDNINKLKKVIEKDDLSKISRTNNLDLNNDIININNNIKEENINNNMMILTDEDDIENNIYEKQLDDFKLLYSDEYLKSIDNEYIKLEIELFLEKFIELSCLYNKEIEEKNLEYQIDINNYYKNLSMYIEIHKLLNKLKFIEAQIQLKKYNIKEIKKNHCKNSINNLLINKKQMDLFRINILEEKFNNKNSKKDIIKIIIKKIVEKEKNKEIVENDEKLKNMLKVNGLYIKDNLKKQKLSSKKNGIITKINKVNNAFTNCNKKLNMTQTKSWKSRPQKIKK